MSLQGKSTWLFESGVPLIATGTAVGKVEGAGPLAADFDVINSGSTLGQSSFEAAEQQLLEQACRVCLDKVPLAATEVNLMFAGDLMNQIISANFTARQLAIPYIGLFGACSTSMLALGLAALAVKTGGVQYALAATSSHNNSAEKQFRYPNEYGAQKNQTCQLTCTAAGAALLAATSAKPVPQVTAVTFGKVVDKGIADPFNMGAAMAPAACDTIVRHLQQRGVAADYYDFVMTGDLGKVGHKILLHLLAAQGITFAAGVLQDGGMLIYGDKPQMLAGGSGCGCCAAVTFGHVYHQLQAGTIKRALIIATGALMSPISCQQKESIPGIAHAVALEGVM